MVYGEPQNCGFSPVVLFGDYLGLGILLKLIIDGKSIIGVNKKRMGLGTFIHIEGNLESYLD